MPASSATWLIVAAWKPFRTNARSAASRIRLRRPDSGGLRCDGMDVTDMRLHENERSFSDKARIVAEAWRISHGFTPRRLAWISYLAGDPARSSLRVGLTASVCGWLPAWRSSAAG